MHLRLAATNGLVFDFSPSISLSIFFLKLLLQVVAPKLGAVLIVGAVTEVEPNGEVFTQHIFPFNFF